MSNQIKELQKQLLVQQVPNVTINNPVINQTVVYNHLDSNTIDIFGKMLALHNGDRAVSYSTRLLDVKDKDRKHAWITNPDLLDAKALSAVIKCEPRAPQLGFEIKGADGKFIKDVDGSKLETILTDTVINAALKSHNYIIQESRRAYEAGDEDALVNYAGNSQIYLPKGQYIQDKYGKFRNAKYNVDQIVKDVSCVLSRGVEETVQNLVPLC
jgi:hypothetical protein